MQHGIEFVQSRDAPVRDQRTYLRRMFARLGAKDVSIAMLSTDTATY